MAKYLYAAAVQGIQSFIFQTNVLKDIVGASELVDSICTEAFKQLPGISWKEENQVIAAAGNVKYVFDTREDCEKAVREFEDGHDHGPGNNHQPGGSRAH